MAFLLINCSFSVCQRGNLYNGTRLFGSLFQRICNPPVPADMPSAGGRTWGFAISEICNSFSHHKLVLSAKIWINVLSRKCFAL